MESPLSGITECAVSCEGEWERERGRYMYGESGNTCELLWIKFLQLVGKHK